MSTLFPLGISPRLNPFNLSNAKIICHQPPSKADPEIHPNGHKRGRPTALWGFSLIVDIGEVIEVISLGGSVGLTRNLLVVIIFKFRQNSFAKI
jgi:hypothetical protein